jgi:hypothetical protein
MESIMIHAYLVRCGLEAFLPVVTQFAGRREIGFVGNVGTKRQTAVFFNCRRQLRDPDLSTQSAFPL